MANERVPEPVRRATDPNCVSGSSTAPTPELAAFVAAYDGRRTRTARQNLGGHDLGVLLDALPGVRRGRRPAERRVRLHDQGLGTADRRRPAEPRRPADRRPDRRSARRDRARRRTTEWDPFTDGSPEGRACAADRWRANERAGATRGPSSPVPDATGVLVTRPVSTQETFGRVLTALANVAGRRRTDGHHLTRCERVDEPRRVDQQDGRVRTRRSSRLPRRPIVCCGGSSRAAGHHVELGISEMNLFLALHALRPRPRAARRAPVADRHRVRPVRLSRPRRPDLHALQRGPLRRRRHACGRHPRAGGRRPPVVRSRRRSVSNCRASPTPSRRSPRRSTGCCATGLPRLAYPDGESLYLRLSTRAVDQGPFLAAKERVGAERLRGDVLAGAYRLRRTVGGPPT